ncbi:metal ABC transporter solute-binding protein, Zn/Mn family [Acidocella sp.]|uniref:metal ABC transporter solute-binding protein, Zn/Mn family n=1 Tax=Acidocella sp. TaxID=50710 RepID=UPI00260316AD|nr:zinc ABC transporter substrate-binding protein [Acidocella sp.]MDD2794331.1 zinc ABC transporter substrate-binding protein [Acidocella sp.]
MRLFRRDVMAGLGGLALARKARAASVLRIVAAENMYGDIAGQISGGLARVTSILKNPNEDPHMFSASPSVARELAAADVVIVNGADYDPWMGPLLAASAAPGRVVINVATLLGRKPGDNPHLWYDPAVAPALIARLVAVLAAKDPAGAAVYQRNGARLLDALAPVYARVAAMRAKYAGTPVSATEPVFGLMARALGLVMRNQRFQRAVMNGTEPAPSDMAAFEDDLRRRRVRVLFYNAQVTDDLTASLRALARRSGVPVVGVSETEPAGMDYQQWLSSGLDSVDKALGGG